MMVLMNPSPGIGAYAHQTPKNVVMFLLIRPSTSTETVRIHPTSTLSGLERVLQSLLAAKPSVEVPGVFHRQGNRTHRRGWQNCSAAPVTTHIRTAQWPEQSLVAFDQCRIDSPSVLFSGPLRRLSSSTAVAI